MRLRVECGSHIGITIVTPGLIQSEISTPEFLSQVGLESAPIESTESCAKTVVNSACRGDFYLTVPSDVKFQQKRSIAGALRNLQSSSHRA
ncbi:conserved hypothetical protein [Ricinus communis]|uniref:Uncharacterized protein n=1 Tax=Ricinus communis TaxID=3988 RepID=B9RAB8_RICCO|nr:conserved hypothetical protein [Ricinus communis]